MTSAKIDWVIGAAGGLPNQRQRKNAPAASASSSSTVKPGTKNFSNCSRERRAGRPDVSSLLKSAEADGAFVSSSYSSRSNFSRSTSRIWK